MKFMRAKNQTKEKILKIARDLVIEKPYYSVSLNMVARKAGITKAALYYHFKNKEDMFLKIFDHLAEDFQNELDKVIHKDLSPKEKLRLFIETYINFFFVEKDMIRLLFQRISQKDKNLCGKLNQTREEIVLKLEKIMTEVMKKQKKNQISPQIAAMMLLGMMGTFFVEHIHGDKKIKIQPKKISNQIINFLNF